MKIHAIDGHEVDVSPEEIRKAAAMVGTVTPAVPLPFKEWQPEPARSYAENTHLIMVSAAKELREATGYSPKNLEELYEFAAKYELFGDREDTHIMMNFLKLFYCLMQRETHTI